VITARDFLVRGLVAGLLAGIAAFAVAFIVGEPSLDAAIALEDGGGHSHGTGTADHDHADAPAGAPAETPESSESSETQVPRSLQSTLGLLTGTAVAGTTLGGLLGVLSALALGRFGGLSARASTLLLAGVGFVSVYVLPFVAYPPNPPAVGSGDTIGYRSALYFVFLAVSIIAAVVAVLVGRRLATRWGGWYAGLAAAAGYLVVTLGATALMPTYDEVPADFPASLLYSFRTASFVTQLTLWLVLGLVLAELVHRATRKVAAPALADVAG
jgi:predicted cobalt transporter CbtA